MKYLATPLALVFALSLTACGGGSEDDFAESADGEDVSVERIQAAATTNTLEVGVTIPGYPHKVDLYRPAGATKALVFLHGQGGKTSYSAYELGFNKQPYAPTAANVNWTWLQKNGVIAVFPQGQPRPGTTLGSWSNFVSDSGQDDVSFLRALSSTLKSKYGATEVTLAGHSAGGAMTARMWCEGTTSFKAFVSIAGPMAAPSYPMPGGTCTPLSAAPYMAVLGGKDSKLPSFMIGGATPTPDQVSAGLTQAYLAAEFTRHHDRSFAVCGQQTDMTQSTRSTTTTNWSGCSGRIRYTIATNADHPIPSVEAATGVKIADTIWAFSSSMASTATTTPVNTVPPVKRRTR